MGKFYQDWDHNVIDYEMYSLNGLELRGPQLSESGDYIAYLGAAQTFGRYCQEPFPTLLGQRLQVGTLNLGSGGKGPQYYLQRPAALELTNRARLAVVQIMSGRSISNSVFQSSIGGRSGVRLSDGRPTTSNAVFYQLVSGQDARGLNPAFLRDLVEETRANYGAAMVQLLEKIRVPTVLLWFSVRSPDYQEVYPAVWPRQLNRWIEALSQGKVGLWRRRHETRVSQLLGDFPHLVNRAMVEQLRPLAQAYVEYSDSPGLPQPLATYDGQRLPPNLYYPSPEMHQQVYRQLLPVCQALL